MPKYCQYSFSLFHLYYTTKLRKTTKNAIKVYFFIVMSYYG